MTCRTQRSLLSTLLLGLCLSLGSGSTSLAQEGFVVLEYRGNTSQTQSLGASGEHRWRQELDRSDMPLFACSDALFKIAIYMGKDLNPGGGGYSPADRGGTGSGPLGIFSGRRSGYS